MRAFSPVPESGGLLSLRGVGASHCGGLSYCGSQAVEPRLSSSRHVDQLQNQGSKSCPLQQQADSSPLSHQGSPPLFPFEVACYLDFTDWEGPAEAGQETDPS